MERRFFRGEYENISTYFSQAANGDRPDIIDIFCKYFKNGR